MWKKIKSSDNKSIIFSRITVAFSFLAVLLVLIFAILFSVSKDNVLSIGHLNALQMAKTVEYYMIEENDEIALAAQTIEIMQDMGQSNEEILDYLKLESRLVSQAIDENYTGIYGYINGEYLDGTGWEPDPGYNPLTRPWYTEAKNGKGKVVYVTPYIDSETGTLMMSISKQLPDKKSVVSLDVSLDRIQAIMSDADYASYDRIYITDKDNFVVASLDENDIGTDYSNNPMIEKYKAVKRKLDANGTFEFKDEDGIKYTVFVSQVEEQWTVFLVKESQSLMSSLYGIFAILIVGIVAFVVCTCLIFNYLNRRRKHAENLNLQLESIADIYVSVYKVDIEKDEIKEVRSNPSVRAQKRIAEETGSGARDILEKMMLAIVREEYQQVMKEFLNLNTLDVRLGSSESVSLEYLSNEGWAKARIIVMERKNDRITSFLLLIENIDEEKRKQSELRYLSETDLMTGIRNRGCGERLIKEQLEKKAGGMFCLLDADHFKAINDNYGHNVGDTVIKSIAKCLERTFVSSDIVMRLGGDEFAAYAVGIENESQSKIIFHRFIDEIEKIVIPELKGERTIQVSVGVSFVAAGEEKSFDTLYREADQAVYESKKTDGNCVTYFSDVEERRE